VDPRISIVTLGVQDLDRAATFYRDGLGLPQREREGDIVFFTTAGTWLALYPWDELAADATVPAEGSGFRGFSLAHNTESREAVDRVVETAAAAGGTVVKPPEDTFWGGYSGYFSDPDGFLWEVAWNPEFPLDE
jgi:catechol 2,3-dioxygenase-like lactoylglutathione lyase family enzyme